LKNLEVEAIVGSDRCQKQPADVTKEVNFRLFYSIYGLAKPMFAFKCQTQVPQFRVIKTETKENKTVLTSQWM